MLCPVCIEHQGWATGDLLQRLDPQDYCRTCLGSGTAPTITVEDGRVRIRSGSVATCNRCDFRSGLTECPCDHWHECVDGSYEPECDATDD